jgi:carboxylesterase type B
MACLVKVLTSFITAPPALPDAPVIDLGYSQYKGVSLPNGVDQYLGMRYSAPPIKDLRFRGTQDPLTADSVQDASKVRDLEHLNYPLHR